MFLQKLASSSVPPKTKTPARWFLACNSNIEHFGRQKGRLQLPEEGRAKSGTETWVFKTCDKRPREGPGVTPTTPGGREEPWVCGKASWGKVLPVKVSKPLRKTVLWDKLPQTPSANRTPQPTSQHHMYWEVSNNPRAKPSYVNNVLSGNQSFLTIPKLSNPQVLGAPAKVSTSYLFGWLLTHVTTFIWLDI